MNSQYRIIDAVGTQEGADAFVHRLFPVPAGQRHYDPFVLWDNFTLQGGTGFPPHPHRGFEGITYVLDGAMHHEDSLGNQSTVQAGGIQRFTAGKGIVHSETPAPEGETNGIQLWVNLSQADKTLPPDYQAINAQDVPSEASEGALVKYVLGPKSAVNLQTDARLIDITLDPGKRYQYSIPEQHQGFIYLLSGDISANENTLYSKQALLFEETPTLDISAGSDGARLLIAEGLPHKEPIRQYGPFVD